MDTPFVLLHILSPVFHVRSQQKYPFPWSQILYHVNEREYMQYREFHIACRKINCRYKHVRYRGVHISIGSMHIKMRNMAHQTYHISCKRNVCLTFHVKRRCWPNCGKMICTISWINYRDSIFHVGRICTGTVKREIKIMASHMWKCLGTVLDLERTENFLFNGGKRVPFVSTGFHIFTFFYLDRDADEWKWNLWCLYTI